MKRTTVRPGSQDAATPARGGPIRTRGWRRIAERTRARHPSAGGKEKKMAAAAATTATTTPARRRRREEEEEEEEEEEAPRALPPRWAGAAPGLDARGAALPERRAGLLRVASVGGGRSPWKGPAQHWPTAPGKCPAAPPPRRRRAAKCCPGTRGWRHGLRPLSAVQPSRAARRRRRWPCSAVYAGRALSPPDAHRRDCPVPLPTLGRVSSAPSVSTTRAYCPIGRAETTAAPLPAAAEGGAPLGAPAPDRRAAGAHRAAPPHVLPLTARARALHHHHLRTHQHPLLLLLLLQLLLGCCWLLRPLRPLRPLLLLLPLLRLLLRVEGEATTRAQRCEEENHVAVRTSHLVPVRRCSPPSSIYSNSQSSRGVFEYAASDR